MFPVMGGVCCSLIFLLIHRHWDFLDEPHFVMATTIALYTTLSSEIDGWIPNIGGQAQTQAEKKEA